MNTRQDLIADPSNAAQLGTWDGNEGAFWVANARRFDESLENCHAPFIAAAAIGEHENVLDVGCGNGQTTRDAARIAVKGSALGVDLSSQMLALARATATEEGLDNVEFRQADAQIHDFNEAAFDVVISRMGSMFFGDPVAAFANLHRALRPGGRITLLTWQGIAENEWIAEFRAALSVGRELPTPPPDAPSPFSLADPDRVSAILTDAGFTDVTLEALCVPTRLGPDVDAAFDFVSELTGGMSEGLDDTGRAAALEALRATITDHTHENGVTYQCATWIIRAHKP
jgi:SAM-dependent methyltransferase